MTLYEPEREAVDRIKKAMGKSVATSTRRRDEAIERELKHALKQALYEYRFNVWQSARLVAAYEYAAEHTALETFNGLWTEQERLGGFKAKRLDPPVIVTEKS